MRIYISVDMEGVSGVTRWADVVTRGQDYQRARAWLTADVNAAIEGARAAGATDFVVEENHGTEMLTNVLLDEIDPDVDVVRGIPRHGTTTAAALDDSFAAVFLIGHHAKVGDYPGFCAHTIDYEGYADVRYAGRSISEGEIFSIIAAELGVPTALITGDQVIAAEMEKVAPGIETAVVKEAMSREGGRIIPPRRAAGLIRDAAQRATSRVAEGAIDVPDVTPPHRMEIDFRQPLTDDARAVFARHPEFSVLGDRTVAFGADEMHPVYRMAAVAQVFAAGNDVRSY